MSVLGGAGGGSLFNLRYRAPEKRENLPCAVEESWALSYRRPLSDEGDMC